MHRILTGILILLVLFLAADRARLRHRIQSLEEKGPAVDVVRVPLPAPASFVPSPTPDPVSLPPVSPMLPPASPKGDVPHPPAAPAAVAVPEAPIPAAGSGLPDDIRSVMTFVLQEKGFDGLDLTGEQKPVVDAVIARRDEQIARLQSGIRALELRAEEEIFQSLTPEQREKYLARRDRVQDVTVVQESVVEPATAVPPPGFLGIQGANAAGGGVTFTDIIPGTSASSAGLLAGDVLLEFNDQKVADYASLVPLIRAQPQGSPVNLKIRRNGLEFTQAVLLGARR